MPKEGTKVPGFRGGAPLRCGEHPYRKGLNLNRTTIASVIGLVLLLALIVAGLVLTKSYFNAKELQALLDGAAEQGIGYEVQIHNPWTGDYSFHPEAG